MQTYPHAECILSVVRDSLGTPDPMAPAYAEHTPRFNPTVPIALDNLKPPPRCATPRPDTNKA